MKKNKKSQVTVFMILALVLIIIFGFLFYVANTAMKIKIQKKANKAQSDIFTVTPIKYYVSTCLDDSLKNGLRIIGKQGGFILKFNDGSLLKEDVPYVTFDNNITYKILSPNMKLLPYPAGERINDNPDYYPCYTQQYGNAIKDMQPGNVNFPILDYTGEKCFRSFKQSMTPFMEIGKIDPIPLNICKENMILSDFKCGCRASSYCKLSIQSQLENFIINQTKQCVNLSAISGYNITKGNPSITNLSITNTHIAVSIDFPFTINMKGMPPITKVGTFFSTQPVRLLQIYNIIYGTNKESEGILYNEFKNITYRIKEDGQEIANLKKDFRITASKSSKILNATIVNITDISEKNNMGGEPYYFQFAIQNRPPVIEYYNDKPCIVDNVKYDICINKTEKLIIKPRVYDFDEDKTYVNYTGWKASPNLWQSSPYYTDSGFCIIPFVGALGKNCASLDLSVADVGPHNITIKARDNQSFDSQNISIYVNNIPAPTLESGYAISCKSKSGNYTPWNAIKNKPFKVKAFCGDQDKTGPFKFEWTTWVIGQPKTTTTIEKDDCEYIQEFINYNHLNPDYIKINNPSKVQLRVIDALGGTNVSSEQTITFYTDNDGDQSCKDIVGGGQNNDCDDSLTFRVPYWPEKCDPASPNQVGVDNDCDCADNDNSGDGIKCGPGDDNVDEPDPPTC